MIEYLYSRILVTLAAVAITGLIISMSASSSQRLMKDLAEDIAKQFVQLVSTAASIDCEHFSADFVVADLPFSLDATLTVRHESIRVVIGGYAALGIFENRVNLMNGNGTVDVVEFHSSTHGMRILSEKDYFKKVNRVTLCLIEISS